MIGLHVGFIFPHFKFFQLGDIRIGGTPSFLGRHCTVRYYLIRRDIDEIKGEQWLDNEHFNDFREILFKLNVVKNIQ